MSNIVNDILGRRIDDKDCMKEIEVVVNECVWGKISSARAMKNIVGIVLEWKEKRPS
jgi:hypothetical protein